MVSRRSAAVWIVFGLAAAVGVQVAVPSCTCIDNSQEEVSCPSSYEIGTCIDAEVLPGQFALYPSTYGESCAVHPEPASLQCSDDQGHPLPKFQRASWCDQPWCYVDPCTCSQADVSSDIYFPSSDLWYSYSNCNGVDTFTLAKVNATSSACPAGETVYTIPGVDSEACPWCSCHHLDNGMEEVPCESMDNSSTCIDVTIAGTTWKYPATYGEGCAKHSEPGDPSCSQADGTEKSSDRGYWCDLPWSWVNPCTCGATDMAKSGLFELYFSYAACGAAVDNNVSAPPSKATREEEGCPEVEPAPEDMMSNPVQWPHSGPDETNCECIPLPSLVPKIECTTSFAQGGKCIEAPGADVLGFFPVNYGAECGVHLEPANPDCFNVGEGVPWAAPCRAGQTSGCRAAWCDEPWCYVDPCTCHGAQAPYDIMKSEYFPNTGGVYYSYANCEQDAKHGDMAETGTHIDLSRCGDEAVGHDDSNGHGNSHEDGQEHNASGNNTSGEGLIDAAQGAGLSSLLAVILALSAFHVGDK